MSAYYPNKPEFLARAKRGNLTPVYKEILAATETPVCAVKKIAGGDSAFLLESVEGGERMARFSFLGSGTDLVIKSKGRTVEVTGNGRNETIELEEGRDVLHGRVIERAAAGRRPRRHPRPGDAVGDDAIDVDLGLIAGP